MEVTRFGYLNPPSSEGGETLCLGNFDGVHRGHQSLLVKGRLEGQGPLTVLLFSSSPGLYLPFKWGDDVLTSLDDKLRYLNLLKVEKAYVVEVDAGFFALSKDEFIQNVLLPLKPSCLVVGEDYRFGKGALGSIEDLRKNFKVILAPEEKDDQGHKISSSSIKINVKEGKIEKAVSLLGHPYTLKGKVVEGFHNGSKIGFPTLNLELSAPYVLPPYGVYGGLCYVYGKPYKAMVNVGDNPTVGRLKNPIVEAHLLDFGQDVYGKTVYLDLLFEGRGEIKFDSLDLLKEQLNNDIVWLRGRFALLEKNS